MFKGKQSKKPKDKIKLLKRFLMGSVEDVVQDVLTNGFERISGFRFVTQINPAKLSTEQIDELKQITDEKELSDRYKEMLKENGHYVMQDTTYKLTLGNSEISWNEEKTYDGDKPPSWVTPQLEQDLKEYNALKPTFQDPEISHVYYSSPDAIVDDFKPVVAPVVSKRTESTELPKRPKKEAKISLMQEPEMNADYLQHLELQKRLMQIREEWTWRDR